MQTTDREPPPLGDHLGRLVRDEVSGCVGVLMDVMAYAEISHLKNLLPLGNARWVAFLRPRGGGCEWVTAPESLTVLVAEEAGT